MNLKILFFRHIVREISKYNRGLSSSLHKSYWDCTKNAAIGPFSSLTSPFQTSAAEFRGFHRQPNWFSTKCIHSLQETNLKDDSGDESEEDAAMNEFLSRFVWIMRGKLSEAFPESDKTTIDAMLMIIVEKVVSEMKKGGVEQMIAGGAAPRVEDFSADLWKTVLEVSNVVFHDMQKAQKKEKMKYFLQSEEVKVMSRFAGEIGIRGDMLRELRFKWAREKMEESEFYENLERLRKDAAQEEMKSESSGTAQERILIEGKVEENVEEESPTVLSLPKRHGKLKYKIYGLDLSAPKWTEVADKIHQSEEINWPKEAKPITGKCKIVTEKIFSLQMDDDPSQLLAEWVELLQPSRVDWIVLLDKLKEQNSGLYFKIAELVLAEDSFKATIRDYSKLIDAYASESRLEDTERILKKMNDNGISRDVLMLTTLVHMYCKAGNLEQAKEAFKTLKSQGLRPNIGLYNSMIMANINSGKVRDAEKLLKDMVDINENIKPTEDILMALLRSYAQCGDGEGAQRIAATMDYLGFERSLEFFTLLVEAWGREKPSTARQQFDYMIKLGYKPDDKCTASMIAAYERKNSLDKALKLLLQLEKNGFEPGIATYTVLLDWFGKLQLIDESEQLLHRIAELGEVPPLKVHISLCAMYASAKIEKKALQALGVVESKKDQLGHADFERIVIGLNEGGFRKDAERMYNLMVAKGFTLSDECRMSSTWHSRPARANKLR